MPVLTDPANEIDLWWCRDFIASSRWQHAKADGDGKWPHSYTVRQWHQDAGTEEDFKWFFHMIHVYGTAKNFYRHRRIYLVIDDHEYWTLGGTLEETTIINRSHEVGKTHGRQEVTPTQTERPVSLYDHVAEIYDGDYTEPRHLKENGELRDMLEPWLGGRVLDLGSGTGFFHDLFQGYRPALYVGLDPSQGMCNEAIRKHQTQTFLPFTLTEYEGWRPRSDPGFDLIVALFSAQYLSVPEIGRLPELLKPKGRLFLVFNQIDYLPHYYERLDSDMLAAQPWWSERVERLDAARRLPGVEVLDWSTYHIVRTS